MLKSFSFLFLITILCFVTVQTVPWNGICSTNDQCDGANTMMICRQGRCACNQPWYRACNNTCVINPGISYERDRCIVQLHCINYTTCTDGRCQCIPDYTPVNGVCLKRLNASCTLSNQCWSQYCFNGRCQCGPGFEPRSDLIRCRRRLVKVFNDWASANSSSEFCFDQGSCIDFRADCVNETIFRSRSYCKCPEGYLASSDNQRCESIDNDQLSPLDTVVTDYKPCGYCRDENAACMKAANRTTCWCRAGYGRVGNQCVMNRLMSPPVIFPNRFDWSFHDYTFNCSGLYNNTNAVEAGLCTCAKGWRYVGQDRPCEKIESKWIDQVYEYGLCTRINSFDLALPEQGLCPFPLKCEARQDKHVCTCGRDRYLDLENISPCVYYIGRIIPDGSIGPCPRFTSYNGTAKACQCLPGYQVVDESRRCELILSQEVGPGSCELNGNLDVLCRSTFGVSSFYCRLGECRCPGVQIVPYENGTRCYSLVETLLQPYQEECPPNSYLVDSSCRCCHGYQATGDFRRCDLISPQLAEFSSSVSPISPLVIPNRCQAPFTGPVEFLGNGLWQCNSVSMINANQTGCWYRLLILIPPPTFNSFCPPGSSFFLDPVCRCDRPLEAIGDVCVPKLQFVFYENDTSAIQKAGLANDDCISLFGTGAELSSDKQSCVCKPVSYPANGNTYCRFFINRFTYEEKTENSSCPENSRVEISSIGQACVCKPGFYSSEDFTTCDFSNATLGGTIDFRLSGSCRYIRDVDCEVKFGRNAICVNDTCFCDRRMSFINSDGRCESFSNYIFPSIHERNYYTCDIDEDCGNRLAVKCDYLSYDPQYKVCQCRDGWLLDPLSRSCVERRCQPECNVTGNFICQGYNCVCRQGYYLNGTDCIPIVNRLVLDQVCNRTDFATYWLTYDRLQCNSSCGHVQCLPGYKVEEFRCVPFALEQEECLFRPNICKELDSNAFCNAEENVCDCAPRYHRLGETCVKAVESRCIRDIDCGGNQVCKGQRCQCNDRQRRRQTTDVYGRIIDHCVNGVVSREISRFIFLLLPFAWFIFI